MSRQADRQTERQADRWADRCYNDEWICIKYFSLYDVTYIFRFLFFLTIFDSCAGSCLADFVQKKISCGWSKDDSAQRERFCVELFYFHAQVLTPCFYLIQRSRRFLPVLLNACIRFTYFWHFLINIKFPHIKFISCQLSYEFFYWIAPNPVWGAMASTKKMTDLDIKIMILGSIVS